MEARKSLVRIGATKVGGDLRALVSLGDPEPGTTEPPLRPGATRVTLGAMVKALKPGEKPQPRRDTEPPDLDDEIPEGPESELKPHILAAWTDWVTAMRGGQDEPGSFPWAKPASPKETAAEFATRAAGELAKLPEARAAMSSVGHGADWEDWVAAVMRYEGGADKSPEARKSLSDTLPGLEEMSKAMGGKLTADEVLTVLRIRLMNGGEEYVRQTKVRSGVPQGGASVPSVGYWGDAKTCAEFADAVADDHVSRLLWGDSEPLVVAMHRLGGVVEFHDWVRAQVLEGTEATKAGDDVHEAVGAASDEEIEAAVVSQGSGERAELV